MVVFPFYQTCCSLKKTVLKVQCNLKNEIELSPTIAVFAAKALDTIRPQRVIRREPKIECHVFLIILQQFLVIFLTPTFISFTKLKIRRPFLGADQV
jgi:hypothetical protein